MSAPDETQEALYHRIIKSGYFNREWYLSQYPAVALLGEDPLSNYINVGRYLGRRPNPHFDTAFYRFAYHDVADERMEPLTHYLDVGRKQGRPCNAAEAEAIIEASYADWVERHCLSPALPEQRCPIVSYCIPVMNRLDDLRSTLATNLSENRDLETYVEFLVIAFGNADGVVDWIRHEFGADLASGYLRVECLDRLDRWHFGRAKNAFKTYMRGAIYSSLDGDNIVTRAETEQLLAIRSDHGRLFLMHHFTGNWGDGTSGRVSLPRELYSLVGYDRFLMPRQYDEMDLILGTLLRFPAVRMLCSDAASSILEISSRSRRYRRDAGIVNRLASVSEVRRVAPENPRGEGYLRSDPVLKAMLSFNAASSLLHNCPRSPGRPDWERELATGQADLLNALEPEEAVSMLFERPPDIDGPGLAIGSATAILFFSEQGATLDRKIVRCFEFGVGHILLVDVSGVPAKIGNLPANTRVFCPAVGHVATARGLWVSALARAFVPYGGWIFVSPQCEDDAWPEGVSDLNALGRDLERRGRDHLVTVGSVALSTRAAEGNGPTTSFGMAGPEAQASPERYQSDLTLVGINSSNGSETSALVLDARSSRLADFRYANRQSNPAPRFAFYKHERKHQIGPFLDRLLKGPGSKAV